MPAPSHGRFGAEWIHKALRLISARPAWALLRVQVGFSEDAHKAEDKGSGVFQGTVYLLGTGRCYPAWLGALSIALNLSSSKAGVLRVPHAGPYLWCH